MFLKPGDKKTGRGRLIALMKLGATFLITDDETELSARTHGNRNFCVPYVQVLLEQIVLPRKRTDFGLGFTAPGKVRLEIRVVYFNNTWGSCN